MGGVRVLEEAQPVALEAGAGSQCRGRGIHPVELLAESLRIGDHLILQQRRDVLRKPSNRQQGEAADRGPRSGGPQPVGPGEGVDGVAIGVPGDQPSVAQVEGLTAEHQPMGSRGAEGTGIPSHVGLKQVHGVDLAGVDRTSLIRQVLTAVHQFGHGADRLRPDLAKQAGAQRQGLVATGPPGTELVAQGLVAEAVFHPHLRPVGEIQGGAQAPRRRVGREAGPGAQQRQQQRHRSAEGACPGNHGRLREERGRHPTRQGLCREVFSRRLETKPSTPPARRGISPAMMRPVQRTRTRDARLGSPDSPIPAPGGRINRGSGGAGARSSSSMAGPMPRWSVAP